MTKRRLINRLKWYYPLEKLHTFFTFPLLLLYVLWSYSWHEIIFLCYGLLVCIFILYQGQLYWNLKLKKLRNIPFNQQYNLKFFRKSRKINLLLLFLMPAILLSQLILQGNFFLSSELIWGVIANIFAVLEYINYYHTQLMIDNKYDMNYVLRNKKLKKASLAGDLQRNCI